jgi:hypothetical protein
MRSEILSVAALCCLLAMAAESQGVIGQPGDDPKTIARTAYERGIDDWNRRGRTDPGALTDDVDLINAMGPHWQGRDTVASNGQQVRDTFRSVLSLVEIESAAEIVPGVIVAVALGKSVIPEGQPAAGEYFVRQLTVFVNLRGEWLIRAMSTTPVVGAP